MILLKTLQLNNFLSHENTTILFGESEKILLDGKSGAGKSAITEAILWVFYNKGRSDNRSLVRRGTKGASVSIRSIDGGKETIITRSISSTGKVTLAVTQNSGSNGQFLPIERVGIKDIQNWIEKDFLKASYELFTNSVAYPQDNENSFVKASAGERKDLLLEIIQAGNFDELYEKTRRLITSNELDRAVTLSKVTSLETTIKDSESLVNTYDFHKKMHDESIAQLEYLTILEKDLETKITNSSSFGREITDKKQIKSHLLNSIKTVSEEIDFCENSILEHKKIDISIHKKNIENIEVFSKEIGIIENELQNNALAQQKINAHLSNKPQVFDYSADIEAINKRLIPLIKETGKCPSGDACPFVLPIKGQIDFLTEQISEKTLKSQIEQTALAKWEKEFLSIPTVMDITGLYSKLKDIKDKVTVLSSSKDVVSKYNLFEDSLGGMNVKILAFRMEKTQHEEKLLSTEKEIKELETTFLGLDLNQVNKDLSILRLSKQQIQVTVNEAFVGMSMAIKAQEALKVASTELVGLNKAILKGQDDVEALELLKEALSPRGIKAVVIDYLVPQLEERINDVLSQMSDFRIRLDTQTAKANDEGVKEGLFITIKNDLGEEMPFESYSGGEKVKITIAISEALASLMTSVGFRIMDENIVSLDKESTESFTGVLKRLLVKFPQLLIVSHLQEVKDMFEKRVEIIKINGVSRIV